MKIKIAKITSGSILLLSTAAAAVAGSQQFRSAADAYLTSLSREEKFSGTVLVATNGEVVFAKGYGLANREHGVANTTNTIFRLGSVTK